jgi:hypothetical protein
LVKIFCYEFKRAVLSKAYLLLLLLLTAYCAYTIKTTVLFGAADTAPFSRWSFTGYLFSASPILSAILLFYVSGLFSPREKSVNAITSSAPLSNAAYAFTKLSVILLAYAFAAAAAAVLCFIFYAAVFDFYRFSGFAVCILIVLVPQMIFLLGTGIWASKLNHNLAFLLIALIFFESFISAAPPVWLDVIGSSLMRIPDGSIPIKGVIPYDVPTGYIVSRAVLCVIGAALSAVYCITVNSSYSEKKHAADKPNFSRRGIQPPI